MDVDLDKEVMSMEVNHPYLALVLGGQSGEVYLVAERIIFESLRKVSSISVVLIPYTLSFHIGLIFLQVLSVRIILIAAYFTFNMEYPKPLHSVLVFVQHFLLGIRDEQTVAHNTTRLLSSLEKIKL